MTSVSVTEMAHWTDPYLVENPDGSITAYPNRRQRGHWITFSSEQDCALHMKIAAEASALFMARKGGERLHDAVARQYGVEPGKLLVAVPVPEADLEPLPEPPLAAEPCEPCQFGNHDVCKRANIAGESCPCLVAGHPMDEDEPEAEDEP